MLVAEDETCLNPDLNLLMATSPVGGPGERGDGPPVGRKGSSWEGKGRSKGSGKELTLDLELVEEQAEEDREALVDNVPWCGSRQY